MVWEHPIGASSWTRKDLQKALRGLYEVVFRQCVFGLKVGGVHVRKGTRIVTTNPCIAYNFNKKCDGCHKHRTIEGSFQGGNVSEMAQKWPNALVRAILVGVRDNFDNDQKQAAYAVADFRVPVREYAYFPEGWTEAQTNHLYAAEDDEIPMLEEARYPRADEDILGSIRRLHHNLGHPEPAALVRTLRLAKASPKALAYARHYLCDTCRALSYKKISRPAKIPVAEYFN